MRNHGRGGGTVERRWLGIDITHLAISLIRHRLRHSHGDRIEETYDVVGEPVEMPDAETLARDDPFQFQCWALGLVGARPAELKKGADKGSTGTSTSTRSREAKRARSTFSVKAGPPVRTTCASCAASLNARTLRSGRCSAFGTRRRRCARRPPTQASTRRRGDGIRAFRS